MLFLLSVIAHAAAAGSLPGGVSMVAAAGVAVALSFSLGSRRRTFLGLVGYLVAGQLLIHVTLVAVAHHGVSFVPSGQMTVAHVVAAVMAAGVFAHGEAIAARWVRAASRLLGTPDLAVVCTSYRRALAVFGDRGLLMPRHERNSISLRGPPTFSGSLTISPSS